MFLRKKVKKQVVSCYARGCASSAGCVRCRGLCRLCRNKIRYAQVTAVLPPLPTRSVCYFAHGRYHYIVPRLQSVSLGVVEVVALLEIEYTVDEEFAYCLAV